MVIKTARLMGGIITADKLVGTLRTHIYIGDETETSSTNTTNEKVKTFTLIRDPDYGLDISSLKWQIENKNSAASGTTSWTILIDTTSTVGSGTVCGTTYTRSTGSTAVSLTTGTHPVDLFLKAIGGTAYTRLFELYGMT